MLMERKRMKKTSKNNQKTSTKVKHNKPFYAHMWFQIIELIVLIVVIRTFLVEAFQVPTGSMIDTILPGDFLLVEKVTYRFDKPGAGDIVVFIPPHNPKTKFVKRCVANAGDTVEIIDRVLYVNNKKSPHQAAQFFYPESSPKNPFLPKDIDGYTKVWLNGDHLQRMNNGRYLFEIIDDFGPIQVPENTFFALGDNRDQSEDSRFWGPVPLENVAGRPTFVYLSTKLIDKISNADRQKLTMIGNLKLMIESIVKFWYIRYDRLLLIVK